MLWKTVKDVYNWARTENIPMLSSYEASFWNEYISNHAKYDRAFFRKYINFRPFMQEKNDDISLVSTDFIGDVYNILLMNDKKYTELFRVHILSADSYNLVNNYDVVETEQITTDGSNIDTLGRRTDNTIEELGERQDNSSTAFGSQTDVDSKDIAGFNSTDYSNSDKVTSSKGARTDAGTSTIGSQSNVVGFDKGEQKDIHDITKVEERQFTRKGNIGIITAPELLKSHVEFWDYFKFYDIIFDDICKELLLVPECLDI